jgi:hypothetical protein
MFWNRAASGPVEEGKWANIRRSVVENGHSWAPLTFTVDNNRVFSVFSDIEFEFYKDQARKGGVFN